MVTPIQERLTSLSPDYETFRELETLQVNLGNRCNLACTHCHVKASRAGDRMMGREVIDRIIRFLGKSRGVTLDMTGGSAEMHPDFPYLVERTGFLERRILRSNLTIMTEEGYEWVAPFCRDHRLIVIGSLPCYLEENVDAQRGAGSYRRSIEALKMLNSLGYGRELELDLVYNPCGPFLPPSQPLLEEAYRRELKERHGIVFSRLFTITNAPVGRFGAELLRSGSYATYIHLLADRFNPETAASLMCRSLVSVDWRGTLYNCDFNQMLDLPITGEDGTPLTIETLDATLLRGGRIRLAQHCYCCTAGEGSSCTGALAA